MAARTTDWPDLFSFSRHKERSWTRLGRVGPLSLCQFSLFLGFSSFVIVRWVFMTAQHELLKHGYEENDYGRHERGMGMGMGD